MDKNKIKRARNFHFRARFPSVIRWIALAAMGFTLLFVGIGFYWGSFRSEFRMKGRPTNLSKDVVGEIKGYQRRESENGVLKYFLQADRALTFSDKHQELEKVILQMFNKGDEKVFDRISADKAIYVPAADGSKKFKIFFAGNVDIATKDALIVKTDQLTYDDKIQVAEAEEEVEFSRDNISGSSVGALVNIKHETLELVKNVEIAASATGAADDELYRSNIENVRIHSGNAFVEKANEEIRLGNEVAIAVTPLNLRAGNLKQPTDIKANKVTVLFEGRQVRQLELTGNVDVFQKPTTRFAGWTKAKAGSAIATVVDELERLELFQNVAIESTTDGKNPTLINSSSAVYTKPSDTFELDNNVVISANQNGKPTRLSSARAVYEQTRGVAILYGNATVTQGGDLVKGSTVKADLTVDRKLKYAAAIGNAYLRQVTSERKTEVTGEELNAAFGGNEGFQNANVLGKSRVVVIPSNLVSYNKFELNAPRGINLAFRTDGSLETVVTKGRTTIKLNVPDNSPDSADKTLTADSIKTYFFKNGNEISKAVAVGSVELLATPKRKSAKNYVTKITGPRFDCDFFAGNNAKSCWSAGNSEVFRKPTEEGRRSQTLTAGKLIARFDQTSQDVKDFEAEGNAKFNEGDRNGISDRIRFDANDSTVRLTGGEPTVWDSKARAKAREIEWNTRLNKSKFKGQVSTTYYSQKATGNSTPFSKLDSPVFITSDTAEIDHDDESALYTGNSRAWQGNNYVRADRLLLEQKKSQLYADGKVQSLLYDVNQTIAGRTTETPVYVSAGTLRYQQVLNLIHYETEVDVRQGTSRMRAEVADIFLDKDNELIKTVVQRKVVITQPNRKVAGEFAEYNAVAETVIVRGNPVTVSDSQSGSSEGREVIVYLKENRVVGSGKTVNNGTGRNRTVYKIKKGTLN